MRGSEGGVIHQGFALPLSGGKGEGGQSVLLAPAAFQVPLAHTDPHAYVAESGMASSAALQHAVSLRQQPAGMCEEEQRAGWGAGGQKGACLESEGRKAGAAAFWGLEVPPPARRHRAGVHYGGGLGWAGRRGSQMLGLF